MITIHTITYNEELLLQFMIDHYRSRFPRCHIVVYDNQSTDKTIEIAKHNNCEIRYYNSNNKVDDSMLTYTKNTCWKEAKTNWVIVCDVDELLDINYLQLFQEQQNGVTIIDSEAYSLVNMNDDFNIKNMDHGFRHSFYDKNLLFNKCNISEINYGAGCHKNAASGVIKHSSMKYKLYHYKYINLNLYLSKCAETRNRMSDINIKNNWGFEVYRTDDELRKEFEDNRLKSIKLF